MLVAAHCLCSPPTNPPKTVDVKVDFLNPTIETVKQSLNNAWAQLPPPVQQAAPYAACVVGSGLVVFVVQQRRLNHQVRGVGGHVHHFLSQQGVFLRVQLPCGKLLGCAFTQLHRTLWGPHRPSCPPASPALAAAAAKCRAGAQSERAAEGAGEPAAARQHPQGDGGMGEVGWGRWVGAGAQGGAGAAGRYQQKSNALKEMNSHPACLLQ